MPSTPRTTIPGMTEPEPTPARGFTVSAALAGSGLLLLGVSAAVYLVLSARMVGAEQFSAIAVLWTLVYTAGIGLFLPFEQELGRSATLTLATGRRLGPLVRHAGVQTVLVLGGLTVVVVALMMVDTLREALFDDSWWFALALLVAAAGLAVQYLQRGVFSATGRFAAYGGQQGAEGAFRIVTCVVLVLADVHDPLAYAAVLALSPWLAALAVLPALGGAVPRGAQVDLSGSVPHEPSAPVDPVAADEDDPGIGWLITATLASQALANLAAPAVRLMSSPDQQEAAGSFLSGLTIARIPLLLYAAVQAVLLPRLVRARHEGDAEGFARQLGAVLGATLAIGVLGVVGVAVAGPWALGLLFGPEFDLPRIDLVLLAVSAGLLMLALALHSAAVALDGHHWVALAWVLGVVAFLVALALPGSVYLRAELALLVGATCVVLLLGVRIVSDPAAGVHGLRRTGHTARRQGAGG